MIGVQLVKLRKIASIEKGLEEIIKTLKEEEIQKAIGKGASYLRKCSDPNPDSDGVKRNILHTDSVELDKTCLKKGVSPPMLTAHQYMIDQEKSQLKSSDHDDVDKMLVKFTILDGELKKVVQEARDPKGHEGEKITGLEKKKIFESIRKIEDKILKIKLAIDKNK